VLAARAAKGQRQIAFAFANVVRQEKQQQFGNAIQKFPGLGKLVQIRNNLFVASGQLAKLRHKMRIGQKTHVKHKVRLQRNPMLVSKTDGRDQKAFARRVAPELVLDVCPQLVDIEVGRVD